MQLYRFLVLLVVVLAVVEGRRNRNRNKKKKKNGPTSRPGPVIGSMPTHPPNTLPSNGDPVNIANQKCEKENPVSVPVCSPIFFPPQNGDLDITLVARIECNSGYDLLPNAQRVYDCESSGGLYDWDNDTMSCCLKDCFDPPDVANGNEHFDCTVETCEVTYTCNSGYFLDGVSSRTCQANGQWSGNSPTCPPVDCNSIGAPDNGGKSNPGHCTTYTCVVNFTCNAGYQLTGYDHSTCLATGDWSHAVPTCQPTQCPTLSDIANGEVTQTGTDPTDTAHYSCDDGYFLMGDKTRTCRHDFTWSGNEPVCALCNALVDVVFVVDGSSSVGSTDFGKTNDFLNDLVETFSIGNVRVGYVRFSSSANSEFLLNTFTTKAGVKMEIDGISYPSGGTNMGAALTEVNNNQLKTSAGDRAGVPNVVVIMTDGQFSFPTSILNTVKSKATVFSIGIGSNVDNGAIMNLASGNDLGEDYFLSTNFDTLVDEVKDALLTSICMP